MKNDVFYILTQTYNFQQKIDDQWKTVRPKNTTANEFGWNNYFYIDTIYAWLDKITVENPQTVTPIVLGNSYEGRPIKGVKLSKRLGNKSVFIEAGIHAREWISSATATFLLNQLIYSNDTAVIELSSSYDWFFVPIINPDGYAFSFDGDRMWRKTRKPNGLCRGADLNRNFNCLWNETGSSPDPCAFDYAGSSVNSEPEAVALSKFLQENRYKFSIETYIALHSYSQLLMFPHGHTNKKPENYNQLVAIGQAGVAALERRYGTKYQTGSIHEIIYPSSGGSMDFAYSSVKIPVAFTMELRGPPNSTDMFILPADQIAPVGWETLDAFVALFQESKKLGN